MTCGSRGARSIHRAGWRQCNGCPQRADFDSKYVTSLDITKTTLALKSLRGDHYAVKTMLLNFTRTASNLEAATIKNDLLRFPSNAEGKRERIQMEHGVQLVIRK
jgi:hypothetical protein